MPGEKCERERGRKGHRKDVLHKDLTRGREERHWSREGQDGGREGRICMEGKL